MKSPVTDTQCAMHNIQYNTQQSNFKVKILKNNKSFGMNWIKIQVGLTVLFQ